MFCRLPHHLKAGYFLGRSIETALVEGGASKTCFQDPCHTHTGARGPNSGSVRKRAGSMDSLTCSGARGSTREERSASAWTTTATFRPKCLLTPWSMRHKAALTVQGKRNLHVFKNEKPKAIKNGGVGHQTSLDLRGSISHADKREMTECCSRYCFQRDGVAVASSRYQEL